MLARRPLSGNELLAVCGTLLARGTDLDAKGVGTRNYPVQRIILVADRGLLSVDHLAMLDRLKVGDQPLEYIVAVPGRGQSRPPPPAGVKQSGKTTFA